MSIERGRVTEVFVQGSSGGRVGSGYLVGANLVLTAAHVVGDGTELMVRPLGTSQWLPAREAWRNEDLDAALLELDAAAAPGSPRSRMRWGRVEGTEPVWCTAVGFPRAQARAEVRDTEQLVGFVAPLSSAKADRLAVTVRSSAPDEGGWAGMSGAALFAGAVLVGLVVVDPANFDSDRVLATPASSLAGDAAFVRLVAGASGLDLEPVLPQVVSASWVVNPDEHGNVLHALPPRAAPRPRRRPEPVFQPARANPVFFGRSAEVDAALDALVAGHPVELHGDVGVGKTWMLSHLSRQPALCAPDGILYCRAGPARRLVDVLQLLFDTFYETDVNYAPRPADFNRLLPGVDAVVALDDLCLDREDVQELLNVARSATFLLAGDEPRLLGEGETCGLEGLDDDAALALVEWALRRPLDAGEREAATALCRALGGHPQRLIVAARCVRENRSTMAEVAAGALATAAAGPAPVPVGEEAAAAPLIASLVRGLRAEERDALGLVSAARGAAIGVASAAAVLGVDDADVAARLAALADLGLVRTNSPSYRMAVELEPDLQRELGQEHWADRALEHVAAWAEEHRDDSEAIAGELDLVDGLLSSGAAATRWHDTVRLARAIEPSLVVLKRWGQWEDVVRRALDAARAGADGAAEAWCHHQLGTRALALDDFGDARRHLEEAARMRRALGDSDGEAVTRHHLDLLRGMAAPAPAAEPVPPSPPPPPPPPLVEEQTITMERVPVATAPPPRRGRPAGWLIVLAALLLVLLGALAIRLLTGDGTRAGSGAGSVDLTVTRTGEGTVTSDPPGINCGSACATSFERGTRVRLRATAARGFEFAGWQGPCTGTSTCEFDLEGDTTTITAAFLPVGAVVHELRVARTGDGTVISDPAGIDCGTTCTASFERGTTVTLRATPAQGWAFAGWQGSDCRGTTPCTISLAAATTVSAGFERAAGTFAVQVARRGDGTVTSEPRGIDCGRACSATFDRDTLVTLHATAAPGSAFAGWEGDCQGTSPCEVRMDRQRAVTAVFESRTHTVTVMVEGAGTVTSDPAGIRCDTATGGRATCSAPFGQGREVTLTPRAAEGWAFAGWEGDCTRTASCAFTINGDKTVTAVFVDRTPPSSPQNVSASASSCEDPPLVSWSPSSDNVGIDRYEVYRSTQGGVRGDRVAVVSGRTTQHQETTCCETYFYTIVAVDPAGNRSSPSAPAEWAACGRPS